MTAPQKGADKRQKQCDFGAVQITGAVSLYQKLNFFKKIFFCHFNPLIYRLVSTITRSKGEAEKRLSFRAENIKIFASYSLVKG